MIRINLLPEAKRQVTAGGDAQLWGVIYLLASFAWGVVLFLVYLSGQSALEEQNVKNQELSGQITRAKSQTENLADVQAKLAKSKELEDVVTTLQNARQGPTRMLMELSKLLSEGGGPTVAPEQLEAMRRDNPVLAYNPGWDFRRLWLSDFTETQGKCNIIGMGRSNEDVAEILRRLNLSETFDNVSLQATNASLDQGGMAVVRFALTCEVKY
jgi:type IV pilus assembly protein PilN